MVTDNKLMLALALVLVLVAVHADAQDTVQPPVAARIPIERTLFGDIFTDYYAWMGERSDAQTITYANDENSYLDQTMVPLDALKTAIYDEMTGRSAVARLRGPTITIGSSDIYRNVTPTGHYKWLKASSVSGGDDVVLIDEDELSTTSYFKMGAVAPSKDGLKLVYTYDDDGDGLGVLTIEDVESGSFSYIEDVGGDSVFWSEDSAVLFYDVVDDVTGQPLDIYRHIDGQNPALDEVVFSARQYNGSMVAKATLSNDGQFLIFYNQGISSNEIYILPMAEAATGSPSLAVAHQPDVLAYLEHNSGQFYLLTNLNAVLFNLLVVPDSSSLPLDISLATVLLPASPIHTLTSMTMHASFIVLGMLEDGYSSLQILNLTDPSPVPEPIVPPVKGTYIAEWQNELGSLKYSTFTDDDVVFLISSLTLPDSLFSYNFLSKQVVPLETLEVVDFNPADYVEYRHSVPIRGNENAYIPLSIVFKSSFSPGSPQFPVDMSLLLEAFGAYGRINEPRFSVQRLSLLDRGVAYAFAHVRGDGINGPAWHSEGRRLAKQTSFDDLAACAQFLVDELTTTYDKLAFRAEDVGGLLAGAALSSIDLPFAAILASASPYLDVLTNMLATEEDGVPWAVYERDEWGDASNNTVYFYEREYDPYYLVNKAASQQSVLPMRVYLRTSLRGLTFASTDALKMTAALRALPAPYFATGAQILLRTLLPIDINGGDVSIGIDSTGELLELATEYALLYDTIGTPTAEECVDSIWCDNNNLVYIIVGSSLFVLLFVLSCAFLVYRVVNKRNSKRKQYAEIPGLPAEQSQRNVNDEWLSDDSDDDSLIR